MAEKGVDEREIATDSFEQVPTERTEALPPGATQVNGLPGWLSPVVEREPHRRGDLRAR